MTRVLVTGGAGYIGSHTAWLLGSRGFEVHIADNLSAGHREAALDFPLHVLDLRDGTAIRPLMAKLQPDAVIHFAAHCYVGESVVNPRKYFEDNLSASMQVLGAMVEQNVPVFIFSSTCATYGEPAVVPIPETHAQDPVNPYGETKWFIERILRRYDEAYGLKYAALRYFNAAGAHPDGLLGESHDPETHLIPLMIKAVLDPAYTLTVFGDDYPTPDGTCIRDYIHVLDLADAHVRAMEWLLREKRSDAFNLGTEHGSSVTEMIKQLEDIAGAGVKSRSGPRRPGDPPKLVADASKAKRILGWDCHYPLHSVLESAWRWHRHPRY